MPKDIEDIRAEQQERFNKDASFVFHGTPDEKLDVEQEIADNAKNSEFDPDRLTQVLINIGQKMVGVTLYDYQKEPAYRIIYSMLVGDGAEITVLYPRQSGKSEVISLTVTMIGILFPVMAKIFPQQLGHFKNGVKMGLLAPQLDQVYTVYERCMERLLSPPVRVFLEDPDINDMPLSTVNFKLKSGSFLKGQSAAKQSKVESKTYHIVYLDECIAKNSNVLTQKGEKRIEDVRIGDYVLSQQNGQKVWDRVTNHWSYGERTIHTVTLSDGTTIEATDGHRIYTNLGWLTILEIKEFLLGGLTIFSYLNVKQENGNKVDRAANIGDPVGGRVHRVRGQKIQQVPTVSMQPLREAEGLCDVQVRGAKIILPFRADRPGKQGLRKAEHNVFDKEPADDGGVPPSMLQQLREKTDNKRVVISVDLGGSSVLVYGRWRSNGNGKRAGYIYPQFFVGRDTTIGGETAKFWYWELPAGKQQGIHVSNAGEGQKYVLSTDTAMGNTGDDVQTAYFGELIGVCDLRQRIYVQQEELKDLLNRVQERGEKEIRLARGHETESATETEGTQDNGRSVSVSGLGEVQIISVEEKGVEKIYDISTENTHAFFANGILVHNSQDLDTEKVRRSIIPMTASTFGTIVRTGTPSRYKGDFYYTIKNNKIHDGKLKSPKEKRTKQKHFEYDYKEVFKDKEKQFKKDGLKFHTLYQKAVERDRASMGDNSDSFRMAYKIEWLLDIGMFITDNQLIELAYNKRINFPSPEKHEFVVGGLDIASARASTVLTTGVVEAPAMEFGERPKKTVIDWLELAGVNYEEQFQYLMERITQLKIQVLFSDYTGVGRALTDILIYHLQGQVEVIPYTFTPSSKSDMWKALDEDLTNRRLIVPAHPTVAKLQEFKNFEEQMVNLTKTWKGPFMICEKTPGFKDDYPDSLGLMNLAGNHLYTPPTVMEVTSNVLINTAQRHSMVNRSRY